MQAALTSRKLFTPICCSIQLNQGQIERFESLCLLASVPAEFLICLFLPRYCFLFPFLHYRRCSIFSSLCYSATTIFGSRVISWMNFRLLFIHWAVSLLLASAPKAQLLPREVTHHPTFQLLASLMFPLSATFVLESNFFGLHLFVHWMYIKLWRRLYKLIPFVVRSVRCLIYVNNDQQGSMKCFQLSTDFKGSNWANCSSQRSRNETLRFRLKLVFCDQ